MAVLLISKSEIEKHLQIAVGLNSLVCNTFIAEAQELDLKPLVCEDFYFDLISKSSGTVWKKALDGGSYAHNDKTYTFSGIAKVLAYFTYARLVLKSNIVSTTHGFIIKKTPHSEPISLEERKNFYYNYRKDANTIFENVKTFLDRKAVDYPSWKCTNARAKTSFKTRVIQ